MVSTLASRFRDPSSSSGCGNGVVFLCVNPGMELHPFQVWVWVEILLVAICYKQAPA